MSEQLKRANKVTVKAVGTGYTADFYRTHKHLDTIESPSTGWVEPKDATLTGKRESFRTYVIENAESFGIAWNPNDMRTDDNKRIAHYSGDELLSEDTVKLLRPTINELVAKCRYKVELADIVVDEIVPMEKTSKGTLLSSLGIEDGKYAKSGNWAWANVKTQATLKYHEDEIYLEIGAELVSGQLKKPKLTITPFNELVKTALDYAGITAEEDIEKEDTKQEEVKNNDTNVSEDPTVSEEQVQEEQPVEDTKVDDTPVEDKDKVVEEILKNAKKRAGK